MSLYDQAQQQSKASQFAAAARSYQSAYAVQADPRLLFSIARALHKDGQKSEAASFYRRFLDSDVDDEPQKRKAQEYLSQLAPVTTPVAAPVPVSDKAAVSSVHTLQASAPLPPSEAVPAYKKGWFWAVVVGSAAAVSLGVGLGVGLGAHTPAFPASSNTYEPRF